MILAWVLVLGCCWGTSFAQQHICELVPPDSRRVDTDVKKQQHKQESMEHVILTSTCKEIEEQGFEQAKLRNVYVEYNSQSLHIGKQAFKQLRKFGGQQIRIVRLCGGPDDSQYRELRLGEQAFEDSDIVVEDRCQCGETTSTTTASRAQCECESTTLTTTPCDTDSRRRRRDGSSRRRKGARRLQGISGQLRRISSYGDSRRRESYSGGQAPCLCSTTTTTTTFACECEFTTLTTTPSDQDSRRRSDGRRRRKGGSRRLDGRRRRRELDSDSRRRRGPSGEHLCSCSKTTTSATIPSTTATVTKTTTAQKSSTRVTSSTSGSTETSTTTASITVSSTRSTQTPLITSTSITKTSSAISSSSLSSSSAAATSTSTTGVSTTHTATTATSISETTSTHTATVKKRTTSTASVTFSTSSLTVTVTITTSTTTTTSASTTTSTAITASATPTTSSSVTQTATITPTTTTASATITTSSSVTQTATITTTSITTSATPTQTATITTTRSISTTASITTTSGTTITITTTSSATSRMTASATTTASSTITSSATSTMTASATTTASKTTTASTTTVTSLTSSISTASVTATLSTITSSTTITTVTETSSNCPSDLAKNLTDFWHDCEVRIQDRMDDGLDYCGIPFDYKGCEKTCCHRFGPTRTNCPEVVENEVEDFWHDCQVRVQDRMDDGLDYCGIPFDYQGCKRTCCHGFGPTDSKCPKALENDLQDFWHDCQVRIQDRLDDGLDYCSIPFDRKGCEKSCCQGFGTTTTTSSIATCGSLVDQLADCATRMRDSLSAGVDYCSFGTGCENSCCLGLGRPVEFTATLQGLDYNALMTNVSLLESFKDTIQYPLAEEAGVDVQSVSVDFAANSQRRLQGESDVGGSTIARISIDTGAEAPAAVASRLDPHVVLTIATEISQVPGIQSVLHGDLIISTMTAPEVSQTAEIEAQAKSFFEESELLSQAALQWSLRLSACAWAAAMLEL